jgi:hypothetical protein
VASNLWLQTHGFELAERAGFEPAVPRRVRWLSKPVLSTTQPPLRGDSKLLDPSSAFEARKLEGFPVGASNRRGLHLRRSGLRERRGATPPSGVERGIVTVVPISARVPNGRPMPPCRRPPTSLRSGVARSRTEARRAICSRSPDGSPRHIRPLASPLESQGLCMASGGSEALMGQGKRSQGVAQASLPDSIGPPTVLSTDPRPSPPLTGCAAPISDRAWATSPRSPIRVLVPGVRSLVPLEPGPRSAPRRGRGEPSLPSSSDEAPTGPAGHWSATREAGGGSLGSYSLRVRWGPTDPR